MHLHVLLSAGKFEINTFAEPGTHGAVVTGIQGMGVSTPKAAAVAAATVGFEGDVHIPNGGILTKGLWSIMVAAKGPPASVCPPGTSKALGATPKVQVIMAPTTTCCGME